jgi:hypothetical protein
MEFELGCLGGVAYVQGNYQRAGIYYEERLEIVRAFGEKTRIAKSLTGLGYISLHHGRWREAQTRFAESLTLLGESGDPRKIAPCLAGEAWLAEVKGRPVRASRLLGAAEALLRASEMHLPAELQADYDRIIADARAHLDEAAFHAAWSEGQAMVAEDWKRAVAYALEEDQL